MTEGYRVLYAFDKPLSVFDVCAVVTDFGMENVSETVFAHEVIGENADALPDLMLQVLGAPHFP